MALFYCYSFLLVTLLEQLRLKKTFIQDLNENLHLFL